MSIDGDKVVRYRVRLGLTRTDVANASGVSYSQVSQIERGDSRGSEHSAKAIADALGLTVDDIWDYDT